MSLWQDRRFLRFWSAQGVSEFGDRVTELALPLLAVTLLDASPEQVGLLTAAVWAPNLLALLIGTWVDRRTDKRPVMIAADLARMLVLLSIPFAVLLGRLSLGQLYLVALLTGTAHVLFTTAYSAFFVRLVERDQYVEANSKLSATRSISFMAGPALGGVLIQWLTAPVAIVVDAASFVFSAVQVSRLKLSPAKMEPVRSESLVRQAVEGMRYLLQHPVLLPSLGCATSVNFFNLIGSSMLILFASRELQLSAGEIGVALGIGASGGLLAASLMGRLIERIGAGRLIAFGTIVFPGAIAIALLGVGPVWERSAALAAAEFVGAFAVMCFDIPLSSIQTAVIQDDMRSRVSGAFNTINFGVRPVGALLGGVLGGWLGVRETLLISAAGGLLAVLWLVGSPILRVRRIGDVATSVG